MIEDKPVMGIEEIKKLIPHRTPFLFIDRVLEIGQNRLVAEMAVSGHDEMMSGHSPNHPSFPDTLLIEALSQAAGIHAAKYYALKGHRIVIAGINNVQIKGGVSPGNRVRLEVELLRFGGTVAKVRGTCSVGNREVLGAEIIAHVL